jgi:predicted alpha/beta superfamily hydrolase
MKALKTIILLFFVISPYQLHAQNDIIASMLKEFPQPYVVGIIDQRYLFSKEANATYQISVYMPPTYNDSKNKFPLMIVTDANQGFGIAQTTVDLLILGGEIPNLIIVGIGYPNSGIMEWARNRFRDMTPTHVEGFDPSGSADKFVSFIKNELFPYVESNYRIDTTNRCYWGHSLGGLLGSQIVLEYPELFNHYIIGSPSYWWDNKEIINRLSRKNNKLPNNIKTIYSYIGGKEGIHITNWKEFNNLLITKLDTCVKFTQKINANETHVSVLVASFLPAVKFVYGK